MKIEVDNIYESDKIRKKLKFYYNLTRVDRSNLNSIIIELNELIEKYLTSTKNIYRKKSISFIGLKYDILLQDSLSYDTIKNYHNDIKRYIDYYPEYDNKDNIDLMPVKITECIVKVEYACLIGNYDYIARKEFELLLSKFGKDLKFYIENEFNGDYDQRSGMPAIFIAYLMAYNFFYDKLGNEYFNWTQLLKHFKEPKYEYYKYTNDEINEELRELKYDFIWK